MRIVLLGAPGSGKGTQGKLLTEKYHVPQISTGDLLRVAVAAGSLLGRQAKATMESGQLVSDEIVLGMIEQRLAEADAKAGFILDGFPRNLVQAEALDELLDKLGQTLQAALLIDVDLDILMQRLTGRRTCESCGQTFNIYSSPSRLEDKCDKCGGNLRHRSDDNEETIGSRLRVYEAQITPLIAYYRKQEKLRTVQGVGPISEINKAVRKMAEKLPNEHLSKKTAPPETKSRGPGALRQPPSKQLAPQKAGAKQATTHPSVPSKEVKMATSKKPTTTTPTAKAAPGKPAATKPKVAAKSAPATKKAAAKPAPTAKPVPAAKKAASKPAARKAAAVKAAPRSKAATKTPAKAKIAAKPAVKSKAVAAAPAKTKPAPKAKSKKTAAKAKK